MMSEVSEDREGCDVTNPPPLYDPQVACDRLQVDPFQSVSMNLCVCVCVCVCQGPVAGDWA